VTPAVTGVKVMLRVQKAAGVRMAGQLLAWAKVAGEELLSAMEAMERLPVPELVRVAFCVAVVAVAASEKVTGPAEKLRRR
jgi:hypothetical protein